MRSDDSGFRPPQPPELQPPWRTDERLELQARARAFAAHVVLPLADELDPQNGEMPRERLERLAQQGWFGITVPAEGNGYTTERRVERYWRDARLTTIGGHEGDPAPGHQRPPAPAPAVAACSALRENA